MSNEEGRRFVHRRKSGMAVWLHQKMALAAWNRSVLSFRGIAVYDDHPRMLEGDNFILGVLELAKPEEVAKGGQR